MTCIVGFVDKDKNKVYIGGDSAGVAGLDYSIREDKKVFQNGKMIFGFTSSFRMGQLLQYSLIIPKHDKEIDDLTYLYTIFIDAVIKCLKDNGYAKDNNNVVSGGTFLFGYNGGLYFVDGDFQIGRAFNRFMACGCGDKYALGAMHIMNVDDSIDPEDRIIRAIKAAEAFSAGVKGPVNIVSI